MRAAIYARVSTEEQAQNFSIEVQVTSLKQHCKDRGYRLSEQHVFVDPGFSGTTMNRPALRQLLAVAEAGEVDIVLVYRLDRLFRSPRHLYNTLYEWESRGIAFASVTENFDTSSPMGKAYLGMLATFAEFERNTFMERSREGTQRAVEKGQYSGGIIPYGYRLDPETKQLQIEEKEARVVRMIFGMSAEERLSCGKIADRLNAMRILPRYALSGIETRVPGKREKSKTAGIWRAGRIRNMLKNTAYYGEWHYGKRSATRKKENWIRGQMPPIISREQFKEAEETLRANFVFSPRQTKRQYLLRGLIKCEACGLTYVGYHCRVKGGERRYYRCDRSRAWRALGTSKCHSETLRAEELEGVVWADIQDFVSRPEVILSHLAGRLKPEATDVEQQLQQVETALKENDRGQERVLRLYALGRYSKSRLDTVMTGLQKEQAALEEHRAKLMASKQAELVAQTQLVQAEQLLRWLQIRIDKATFEEKRLGCERLVEGIWVSKGDHQGPRVRIRYRFAPPEEVFPYLRSARLPLWLLG